jgi:hypothetical protein
MTPLEARQKLKRDLDLAGSNLAEASRELKHHHAYLHQFVTRGKPKYLHERDREVLRTFFKINVEALKPPPPGAKEARIIAGKTRNRPRVGDPIETPREADIIHTWRQLSEQDQDFVVRMLDGLRGTGGGSSVAA